MENVTQKEPWWRQRQVFMLFITFLVFTSNIVSRYMLIFVYSIPVKGLSPEDARYQSMKEALHMNSTEYGVLTGPAFTGLFAIGGLVAGWLSDNSNRRNVISMGCLVWSLACAAMGLCNAYWQVLLARFILGFSQAFCPALSYSMIADWFAVENRATANGFFASGVYLGYGISSLSLLIIPSIGWRAMLYSSGAFGLLSVILFILIVREPIRPPKPEAVAFASADDTVKASKYKRVVEHLKSLAQLMRPTDMMLISIAGALRMIGGLILGAYLPPYMKKYFPNQKSEFSSINSAVVVVSGLLSSSFGGRITDHWSKRSTKKLIEEVLRGDHDSKPDYLLHGLYPSERSENSLMDPLLQVQNSESSDAASAVLVENDENALPSTLSSEAPKKIVDLTPFALTPALGNILMTPFLVGVFLVPNLFAAMTILFFGYIVGESWYAPLFAIIQNGSMHPPQLKGSAIALLIFTISVMSSPGTVIVGAIDDKYQSIRTEVLIGTAAPTFLSGLIFLIVARNQRRSFLQELYRRKRDGTLVLPAE